MVTSHHYRQTLLSGVKATAWKPTNLSKVSETIQQPNESPVAPHSQSASKTYCLYIVVDTKAPENRSALNIDFVTQSAPDIRKKLQRQEEFERKMLSELVKIVQKNYNKQNPPKDRQAKHMTKIMVTTMAEYKFQTQKDPPHQSSIPIKGK